jgi:zinc/manganese transport system ATP-binding protein
MGGHILGGCGAMRGAAISLDDVTIAYDRHPAVHHVHGRFAAGSLTAICGPNGAGKSTLIKAIVGALTPATGSIERDGLAVRDIGYLPQAAEIDRSFPLTVADAVLLGAWRHIGAFRGARRDLADKARATLGAVGLAGFERRSIGSLSAGQFQRVLFARLLLQDAAVFVLDEPFTAIDARTTHDLLQVIRDWNSEGRTVLAVLHDHDQVRAHFPDTLLLTREALAWGPTAQVLTPENLARAKLMAENSDEAASVCASSAMTPAGRR